VRTRSGLTFAITFLILGFAAPLFAQEPAAAGGVSNTVVMWSIVTGGWALAVAAAVGGMSQSRALKAAVDGIARNPSAAPDIRFALILGLVLIESLVIYVLLISLILFFVQPFGR
jgi:F-type H+-transporting ATPase subunit c